MKENRYACQVHLPGFGHEGQAMLKNAKVLIVGIGGLGCPAAQYLVASGIGTIGMADGDVVQERNLNRQVLYTPTEVGLPKADVAVEKLRKQNPEINITAHGCMLNNTNVQEIVGQYDIVVDCSDNFETRYLLNDTTTLLQKPLVYGAVYQYEGHVAVWNYPTEAGPTASYRDAFPKANISATPDCNEGGVIPTLTGIIGCMQANEVIKCITKIGTLLTNQLLIIDALTLKTRSFSIKKRPVVDYPAWPQVHLISLQEYHASPDNFYLIDVREMDEREQYHIGGVHMPLHELLDNSPLNIDDGKKVLFYCATGKRSAFAAANMSVKHAKPYYSLLNGIGPH